MLTEQQKKQCEKILNYYGLAPQKNKIIEELSELSAEIARDLSGDGNANHIREELADVIIMIEQACCIYGYPADWVRIKLERIEKRMGE